MGGIAAFIWSIGYGYAAYGYQLPAYINITHQVVGRIA